MKGSHRLLNHTFVPYIFMVWGKMFSGRYKSNSPALQNRWSVWRRTSRDGDMPCEVRTGFQLSADRCSTKWKIGDIYWRHELADPLQDPF